MAVQSKPKPPYATRRTQVYHSGNGGAIKTQTTLCHQTNPSLSFRKWRCNQNPGDMLISSRGSLSFRKWRCNQNTQDLKVHRLISLSFRKWRCNQNCFTFLFYALFSLSFRKWRCNQNGSGE